MVMLRRPPHQIAAAVPPGVHFTDETESGKYLKRAINSHQPDAGVLLAYPLINLRRGEVLATTHNGVDDSAALRGYLIATLSQFVFNFLLGINHIQTTK